MIGTMTFSRFIAYCVVALCIPTLFYNGYVLISRLGIVDLEVLEPLARSAGLQQNYRLLSMSLLGLIVSIGFVVLQSLLNKSQSIK